MEEFFRSVREAFPDPLSFVDGARALLFATIILLIALLISRYRMERRRRARRLDFGRAHGLSNEDLTWLDSLAQPMGIDALTLATHVEQFERSTGALIAPQTSTPSMKQINLYARIQRVRHALGFHPLLPSRPLVTTRELPTGFPLHLDGCPAQTTTVDESSFTVRVVGGAWSVGAAANLAIVHDHEARYRAACRILSVEPGTQGTTVLVLAHDEAPERFQGREFARVAAYCPVQLRPRGTIAFPAVSAIPSAGHILDLSGGGMLIEQATDLPIGATVECDFLLDGTRFQGLEAIVVHRETDRSQGYRLRLEFQHLRAAVQDRLVALITRRSSGRPLTTMA